MDTVRHLTVAASGPPTGAGGVGHNDGRPAGKEHRVDQRERHADGSAARRRACPRPRTFCDVFAATVACRPRAPAIDDADEVLSHVALAEAVRLRAERLAAVGVRRGDRVGVRATSGTVGL